MLCWGGQSPRAKSGVTRPCCVACLAIYPKSPLHHPPFCASAAQTIPRFSLARCSSLSRAQLKSRLLQAVPQKAPSSQRESLPPGGRGPSIMPRPQHRLSGGVYSSHAGRGPLCARAPHAVFRRVTRQAPHSVTGDGACGSPEVPPSRSQGLESLSPPRPRAWGAPLRLLGQPAGDPRPVRPCSFKQSPVVGGGEGRWGGPACFLALLPTHG